MQSTIPVTYADIDASKRIMYDTQVLSASSLVLDQYQTTDYSAYEANYLQLSMDE
ncbi:hypothetical protein D3C78_1911230 [compost metagenome]